MTGLVRKATLLTVCGLMLVAGAAIAGVPNAANSQKPCIILMDISNSPNNVGTELGVCIINNLKVIVRDALNNPVANSDVVLDFSTCGASPGPVMLADTQADPAVTIACGGRTVLKTTNALGEVCFSVIGSSNQVNPGPGAGVVCCKLYASGNLLGTQLVIRNKYDLNSNGDVNAGDGGLHIDAQGAAYSTFGDYNCNGTVNAGDGGLHLDAQGNAGAGEVVYAGGYCP